MKVVIYGLGAIIIFVLLANLLGIAFTLLKFHELKASALREAAFLIIAALLAIWATQRLANLSHDSWKHVAQVIGSFLHTHKWWLIGASGASIAGLLTMGAPGGLLFTVLNFLVDHLLVRPLGWQQPRGDTVWPTAIVYSLFVPWVAFAVFLGLKRVWLTAESAMVGWITCATTFLIFLAIHVLYRRLN